MVNDAILAVGGDTVSNWDDVISAVWERREEQIPLRVLRGADTLDVGFRCVIEGKSVSVGFGAYVSSVVGQVKRDGPAYRAGIRPGAVVEAINDTTVTTFYDIERIVHGNPKSRSSCGGRRTGSNTRTPSFRSPRNR